MRYLTILASAVAIGCAPPPSLRAQAACHVADESSAGVIAVLKRLMTSEYAAARTNLGLPLVPPSSIVLVSDAGVCARAGQAADSLVRVWNPNTQVPSGSTDPLYVFKIGSSHGVLDLHSNNEGVHWLFMIFFDSVWAYTARMAI